MTQIFLIRHAVNDFVKTGKLAGWTPGVHLNDDGKAQAAALGVRLAETKIHAIYASPLERTVETAQAVIAHHPELQLQMLEDVGEVRFGAWQGAELNKLSQRKLWRMVQGVPSRVQFPSGETFRQSQLRAVNAVESLFEKHPRQTVAVVSHSDVIKLVISYYLGMHIDMFQRIEISPASLTILTAHGGRPTIIQVNETTYLPKPRKHADPIPVETVTVDAVGQPGERVFYLQARRRAEQGEGDLITLVMEKTQAGMLGEQIAGLFEELAARTPPVPTPEAAPETIALGSTEQVLFRMGKFGLQYSPENDCIVVEIEELKGADQGAPETISLQATRPQIKALGDSALRAARGGRRETSED